MAVLSALLVFVSIAAFATIYASANHQQEVLMVTRTIEQGQPILAEDLGQTNAAISGGVVPVPVSDAPGLSGRRASVTIPSGSLLTMADTTRGQPIPAGYAVVGMALKPGQLPSNGVEPGDQVMVVETGSPGTPLPSLPSSISDSANASPGTGVLVPQASVFEVAMPPTSATSATGSSAGDSDLVSVQLTDSLAPAVSAAAAADEVSLVLLPGRHSAQGAGDGIDAP